MFVVKSQRQILGRQKRAWLHPPSSPQKCHLPRRKAYPPPHNLSSSTPSYEKFRSAELLNGAFLPIVPTLFLLLRFFLCPVLHGQVVLLKFELASAQVLLVELVENGFFPCHLLVVAKQTIHLVHSLWG